MLSSVKRRRRSIMCRPTRIKRAGGGVETNRVASSPTPDPVGSVDSAARRAFRLLACARFNLRLFDVYNTTGRYRPGHLLNVIGYIERALAALGRRSHDVPN